MTTADIPLVDLGTWRRADAGERARLAARLDAAMRTSGFFLVGGHAIPGEWADEMRAAARRFFALPAEVKDRYRTHVGGRGWIAAGDEANSFYGQDGDAARPDLKESLAFGREHATGDPAIDADWFAPNVWPAEVPELRGAAVRWMAALHDLYDELLVMLAVALGLPERYFLERALDSPHGFNINRYPALTEVGAPQEGQYRVAPHTDWGMLTILDRQPGYGGLQVQTLDGAWVDAPFVAGAFTVNIADTLGRWTGDRWRSTRHRVLPPSADAPAEELVSLIMFMEVDMDQVVEPLPPPVGGGVAYEPVMVADYFTQRANEARVV